MKACMATNNGQIVGIYSVTSELIKELRKGKDASSNYSMYIAGTYSEALEGCSPVYTLCIYIYIILCIHVYIYMYIARSLVQNASLACGACSAADCLLLRAYGVLDTHCQNSHNKVCIIKCVCL